MNKYVIANWKMNATIKFIDNYCSQLKSSYTANNANIVICPPAPYLNMLKTNLEKTNVSIGGQDCSAIVFGAKTSEVSCKMLLETGCEYVIIGHSERRSNWNETDAIIANKVATALENKLKVILCVGETSSEKSNKQTQTVLQNQVKIAVANIDKSLLPNLILAYEPVWAIGSGTAATINDIENTHKMLKSYLLTSFNTQLSIIYGGSVTTKNYDAILSTKFVDGVLVGGAALDYLQFQTIINYYR